MAAETTPTLELRLPISPDEGNLRSVRYLLESLQEFGGPIARSARCVASVGADEPPRELGQEYPWTAEAPIDFQWVDRERFRKREYDETGLHRFHVESNADVVIMADADLLVAGDFDQVVRDAHRKQVVLGFIAHVSPFSMGGELSHLSSEEWWNALYREAGLPPPALDRQYTAWALAWGSTPYAAVGAVERHPHQRHCPAYYNYGFVVAPRRLFDKMAETYETELDIVDRVVARQAQGARTGFRSQIANCLAFDRHGIPCEDLSINFNFPLNLPTEEMRALNPDPEGKNRDEDVSVFHYIGGREHFATREALDALLARSDLDGTWAVFQQRLRRVHARIESIDATR